jgi:hypothetical protein
VPDGIDVANERCRCDAAFVSVAQVKICRGASTILAVALLAGCGPDSTAPGTVDPGQDFSIADVVYDENYFYCVVEPMLFSQACGPGDSSKGDGNGSCHFNVTSYRLADYNPLIADTCNGIIPTSLITPQAKANYGSSQAKMQLDPKLAPLLNRPTGKAAHPRVIFTLQDPPADVIRQWATKFSTQ